MLSDSTRGPQWDAGRRRREVRRCGGKQALAQPRPQPLVFARLGPNLLAELSRKALAYRGAATDGASEPDRGSGKGAMHFQLIVFDWDGTLMDSEAKIVACIRAAFEDVGAGSPTSRPGTCSTSRHPAAGRPVASARRSKRLAHPARRRIPAQGHICWPGGPANRHTTAKFQMFL